jgi:uncharacterized protein YijF (DUF1287 family)
VRLTPLLFLALATGALAAPEDEVLAGARRQVEEAAVYTTGYFALAYPGGDLPRTQGVCTDVVVRALRDAGHDLQVLVHEDMGAHFQAYPQNWGLTRPDPNIDHRRVPNQVRFLERHGQRLPTSIAEEHMGSWRGGDIVYWKLPNGLDHAGVVTDRRGPSGLPMVIHNLGITDEEDVLGEWRVTGHFRFPPREADTPAE